ncbi:MAG: GIY-YIG nuclease family protein [bacterium]|nr:GIY-YIG nuclease family protein [bacterium]
MTNPTTPWFLYILLCQDGSLYTGISTDPDRRFQEHLLGKGGNYTRAHRPVKRVYLEKVGTRSDALKRELEIKSWERKKKEEFLQSSHHEILL